MRGDRTPADLATDWEHDLCCVRRLGPSSQPATPSMDEVCLCYSMLPHGCSSGRFFPSNFRRAQAMGPHRILRFPGAADLDRRNPSGAWQVFRLTSRGPTLDDASCGSRLSMAGPYTNRPAQLPSSWEGHCQPCSAVSRTSLRSAHDHLRRYELRSQRPDCRTVRPSCTKPKAGWRSILLPRSCGRRRGGEK